LLLALSRGRGLVRGEIKSFFNLFVITKEINSNSPHPTLPSKGELREKAMYPLSLAKTHGESGNFLFMKT